jgi:peptidoglycan endopeptidase LytE
MIWKVVMKRSHLLLILFLTFFLSFPHYTLADTIYVIKKGDSLYKISKKFGISIKELKKRNKLISSRIKRGREIVIPAPHTSNIACNSSKPKTIDKTLVSKSEDETQYYTVKRGDTLSTISREYSIPVSEIRELNDLRSTKLKPGQKLLINQTVPKTYVVKKGDNIYRIAKKFNIDADKLKNINSLRTDILKPGEKFLLEPEKETRKITSYEAIISEAQIEKEIKEVSEAEELSLKDKLILFAKKFLDTPYRFGGNSLLGIDCSAFVQKVYAMIGIDLPRSAREQFSEGTPVDTEKLSIGDLVFFRTYAPFPSHVGIYLGDNLFIHASSKEKRVTIDSLTETYYLKRFIGAKRFIGEGTIVGG